MNSPQTGTTSTPTFKNLLFRRNKQSPVEMKDKMRKNYKDKVKNCRNMLINKFRGPVVETDLRNTLTEIYKSMFNFSDDEQKDDEEYVILDEIKSGLVQEELDWWLQEYEKSQMENIDWSSIEQDDEVICPVCQKTNLSLQGGILSCLQCKYAIKTQTSLLDIKGCIVYSIKKHSSGCNNEVQFTLVPESNETHIYLICDICMEMQLMI